MKNQKVSKRSMKTEVRIVNGIKTIVRWETIVEDGVEIVKIYENDVLGIIKTYLHYIIFQTFQHTGCPNKNVAIACCCNSAAATFFLDTLYMFQ